MKTMKIKTTNTNTDKGALLDFVVAVCQFVACICCIFNGGEN